ncbi:tellurite resistance/C4-dicarboxylate transporter family protein [soil metagenome]
MSLKIADIASSLFPGYFAYVMATGIVASGLNAFGYTAPAHVLFWLGAIGFLILWTLSIYRAVCFRQKLWTDFSSFGKGAGFFTTVAASSVLGALSIRLYKATDFAFGMLCLGAVVWLVMTYAFATVVIVSAEKPAADRSVNGGWLVIVVSTQSLSLLCSMLADRVPLFLGAGLFMMGGATYLLLISIIVSRLILTHVEAADLAPPYWIMMGAAAISCVAGVELNKHSGTWGFDVNAFPVLQAFTLFFWIVATAWIPLLIILGIWRHGVKRVPLRYEPQLWSIVFPLGMYTFATYSAAMQFKLHFILPIASAFLPVACLAWIWIFCGMVASWARVLFSRDGASTAEAKLGPIADQGK